VASSKEGNEVTGLIHLVDKKKILSVGWDKRIITFPDVADVSIKPNYNLIIIHMSQRLNNFIFQLFLAHQSGLLMWMHLIAELFFFVFF